MLLTSNGRQTCDVPSERNFLFLEMLLVLMGWAGWESLPHLMHLYFSPQIYERKLLYYLVPSLTLYHRYPSLRVLKTYYWQTTGVRRASLFPAVKKLQSVSWETSVRLLQVLLHSQVKSEQAGKV